MSKRDPGRKLKFARLRRGLRQYEVADALGISPQRLSEIEAGRKFKDEQFYDRAILVIRSRRMTKS